MKEFLESLFGSYKGRYKNKFIGTFFLVYVALSWEKFVALLFISEMSYKDFIFIWSDDFSDVFSVFMWAFILSCLYLALIPWLSYIVHVAQSKAITQFKIKTLKNESEVNKEKALMYEEEKRAEVERSAVLDAKQKNIESEAAIKKTEEAVKKDSSDREKYKTLISLISETKLRDIFYQVGKGELRFEDFNIVKDVSMKIQSIDYSFDSDVMEEVRLEFSREITKLFNILSQYAGNGSFGYTYKREDRARVMKIENDIILAYRNIFTAGKTL